MEVEYTLQAREDLSHWKKVNDQKVLKKIRALVESILENPYSGIGKPELLKHSLSGCWSRRISQEHRVVYSVEDEVIYILSLRGHYRIR